MRNKQFLLIVLIILVIFGLARYSYSLSNSQSAPSNKNTQKEDTKISPTEAELVQNIFLLINSERKKAGQKDLIINPLLNESARLKSQDMIDNNYYSHVSPKGLHPWDFFDIAGVKSSIAGENFANGLAEPQAVIDSWLTNSSQKNNLLSPSWVQVGISVKFGITTSGLFSSPLVVVHFAST